jgi:DNA-binding LytR/AlgR family response regulator
MLDIIAFSAPGADTGRFPQLFAETARGHGLVLRRLKTVCAAQELTGEDLSQYNVLIVASPRLLETAELLLAELLQTREALPEVFMIKNGAEYLPVRLSEIFFFEAKAKKMALKTKSQEITFYATFEQVTEQLPAWFMRVHKGFIVNTRKIKSANFSELALTMTDGSAIPISRRNKADVRAMLEQFQKAGDET